MPERGAAFAAAPAFGAAVLLVAAVLLALLVLCSRRAAADTYVPLLAWLRAGIYFCVCLLVAASSGALALVLQRPLATAAQWHDPRWWAYSLLCGAVVVVAYAVIWPRGTFTDGRRAHPLLSLVYGSVWGLCQGLLFVSIWLGVARSGLAPGWVAVVSYLLIGTYNGLLHRYFWDIQVSPPHNYSEWNARKVLLCHTPNLIVCLSYLAVYANFGIFVLLQAVALAASARAMRFPAPWDDYRAVPGQERSLAAAR